MGVVVYFALVPVLALIPFRGEALGVEGVLLGWPALVAVPLGVSLLAAVSAVIGLRLVVISPLGVRTRQDAPKLHWLRLVIGVVVVALAAGRRSEICLGEMDHTGPGGYLDPEAFTPDGRSYLDVTASKILEIVDPEPIGPR